MSFKQDFINWILRQDLGAVVVSHQDVLHRAAVEINKMSSAEADAFVDANATRYWNDLCKVSEALGDRGIQCLIDVIDNPSRRFRTTDCGLRASATKRDRACGLRLPTRASILRMIDGLNDRQYEALACVASKAIGASRTHLTPPGNEGGIDFLALIPGAWPIAHLSRSRPSHSHHWAVQGIWISSRGGGH